jgi:repressor LexA
MAEKLTERQKEVFEFIRESVRREHKPPTVREIAAHFGFRSPKAVTDHLNALERKGYIDRRSRKSRNIEVREEFAPRGIPIVGRIAAGSPILALENIEESLSFETAFEATNRTFALRVQGESMREAGIFDGDYVIVEGGQPVRSATIAAVRLGEEATVKRVFFEGATIRLHAENPEFKDITADRRSPEVEVFGPVKGIVRRMPR